MARETSTERRSTTPAPGKRKARSASAAAKAKAQAPAAKRNSRRSRPTPSQPARASLRTRLAATWERARGPVSVLLSVALMAAVVAGATAGFRLLRDHIKRSEAFALEHIDLTGNERVPRQELLATAGLSLGKNVFALDDKALASRLRLHPWIREAEVRRRLPDRYALQVKEHHPVATVALGPLYLLSREGQIFKRWELGDPADLPVVTGLSADQMKADPEYRERVLLAVVAFLEDFESAGLLRLAPMAELHVEANENLSLFVSTKAQPVHVRLGQGPYKAKLGRLYQVLSELRRRGARPAYVYLDHERRPDRATVKLQ